MHEMSTEKYKQLVKQVYIDPIRTVVVVDDDFPTLDDLLLSAESGQALEQQPFVQSTSVSAPNSPASSYLVVPPSQKRSDSGQELIRMKFEGKMVDVDRMKDLLALCRKRNPPWMIDVHDGRANTGMDELRLAPSLHQSDLMILDFHLNGDQGDGQRAIDILRTLASNDQFNLVVVYTKGIGGEINSVFEQIATALANRNWSMSEPVSKLKATEELITDWEDEAPELDIIGQLLQSFSTIDYLRYRSKKYKFKGSGTEGLIDSLLAKCPVGIKNKKASYQSKTGETKHTVLNTKSIFDFLVSLKHVALAPSLSEIDYGGFSCDIGGDKNWIRAEKIFITVVNKTTASPHTLESCLLDALEVWAPGPHQLLMGKMRAELGEKGVCAEGAVLANRPLQAGWLHDLLDQDADVETVMTQSINRHWEALGGRIHQEVKKYAKEMFDYFRSEDAQNIKERYMPTGIRDDDRLAHLNHYYSTKPIDSPHMTTGHILKFDPYNAGEDDEYWMCLSPACDLVPGQKTEGWRSRLGQMMPFVAVKLEMTSIGAAMGEVNQNRFVFVQIDENICAFKFTSGSSSTSLPNWEHMFAANGGKFSRKDGKNGLNVQRMRETDGNLVMDIRTASVVCQLRYEYALNFLQRLGSVLSRVGLDFKSL
ncbi:response regulator receiver domain [Achromobacter xylosoxidans]|uniref:response regulator receiver domain n=1 Tax=Alcaligenes xylosoxydans xylosoxydans TaxID=85698 RepID=UPI000AD1F1EB|nr:response regulator receiver domain [Achromobacter xylosoxidans]